MSMKKCSKCRNVKPESDFYRCKTNKTSSYCKPCIKIYQDTRKEVTKEKSRDWHLKRKFGITQEDYKKILEEQNSLCAICGADHYKEKKGLYVDHNHETGEIRGLLCNNCNCGIGYLKDDVKLLNKAIKYISKGE